jgi:hypothetical protein
MQAETWIRKIGKRKSTEKIEYPTINLPRNAGFSPGDMIEIYPTVVDGQLSLVVKPLKNCTSCTSGTKISNASFSNSSPVKAGIIEPQNLEARKAKSDNENHANLNSTSHTSGTNPGSPPCEGDVITG